MAPLKPYLNVAVCTLLLLGTVAAEAQTAKPLSDACSLDPACERHYLQARTLFKAGQFGEALNEYHEAYAIQRVPTLLFNIARINHKLGRLKEAASAYEAYLSQEVGTDVELRTKAKEYLTQIQREIPSAGPLGQLPEKPAEKPDSTDLHSQVPAMDLVPFVPPEEKISSATPLYKRWWVWTAVGGVVLVGTIGAIIGTQVDPRPKPTLLFDLRGQL